MGNSRKRRRLRTQIHRRSAPGTTPGTINVAPDALVTSIDVIAYDKERCVDSSAGDGRRGERSSAGEGRPV
jgi:hypothetical protein